MAKAGHPRTSPWKQGVYRPDCWDRKHVEEAEPYALKQAQEAPRTRWWKDVTIQFSLIFS